jgi:hypothetical protein
VTRSAGSGTCFDLNTTPPCAHGAARIVTGAGTNTGAPAPVNNGVTVDRVPLARTHPVRYLPPVTEPAPRAP